MTAPDGTLTKAGYCDEDRAQVLALRALHYGYDTIADKTGIPKSTVRNWIHRYADVILNSPELMEEEYRIARRVQEITHDALDALVEQDYTNPLLKFMFPLNAIRGTAIDKLRSNDRPPADNRQLVIVIPGLDPQTIKIDAPDTIDADAIPLPEPVNGNKVTRNGDTGTGVTGDQSNTAPGNRYANPSIREQLREPKP